MPYRSTPSHRFRWACLPLLVAGSALAQQPGASTPDTDAEHRPTTTLMDGRVFQRLDANGDGRLTREEARIDHAVTAAFDTMDANGDGVITREEAQQFADRGKDADRHKR